ncbi:hypothetical protein CLOP_g3188 [Closterium sp. NIES-67]|nr:hypothetical protein CLOP_g3188 [Closterium sp. NIES-67]
MAENEGAPLAQGARGETRTRGVTDRDDVEKCGAEGHDDGGEASTNEDAVEVVEEERREGKRDGDSNEGNDEEEDYLVLSEVHVACPSHHVSTVSTFTFRLPPAAEAAMAGKARRGAEECGEGREGSEGGGMHVAVAIGHGMKTTIAHVGMQVWRASLLLADVIIANHHMLADATVLELGAGTGMVGVVAALFARRVFLTDTGDPVLRNCAANAANAPMLRPPCGMHSAAPVVRRLDWRLGWPPPVVTRGCAQQPAACGAGSGEEEESASGMQAESNGAADPFVWTDGDLTDASHATVLLAADVIYSDDITAALFSTLRSLLHCAPPELLLLALEKRFNFSLSHLAPVANGYAAFRSHFAAQTAAPSCHRGSHCSAAEAAVGRGKGDEEADGREDDKQQVARQGVRQRGWQGGWQGGGVEEEADEGKGEQLVGWRMDVACVPRHVVGCERAADMELWVIGARWSVPLICAWMERGVGLQPASEGAGDILESSEPGE